MAEIISAETSTAVNGVNGQKQHSGLNIIIIGAGIGGLSAAIGLRKQGHYVQVSISIKIVIAMTDV
jgi:ribulose 1,5-bisphosphate synthetase/thiazole synthase